MSKGIVLASIVGLGLFAGPAFADSKSDAQAKVDQAKTDTCEKEKKFLSEQDAKGKCKDENAAAKKITCSAATEKDVRDLQNKCISAKPATKDDTKKDDKAAEPAAAPKCRALDPKDAKVVFAEAEDKLATKCTSLLLEKLQTHFCTDAANKGKSFDYMAEFEHTIAKKQMATKKKSYKCITIGPLKKK